MGVDGHHVGARDHDLAHEGLAQLDDAAQHFAVLVLNGLGLADLVDHLAQVLGDLGARLGVGQGGRAGGGSWSTTATTTVQPVCGRVLNQSKSLPEQRIRPGAVLTVEPSGTNVKDQRYDDLVEAVGTAVAENSVPWEKTSSVQLSAATTRS